MAIYLWLKGLDGRSAKLGHKNEIALESIWFGGSNGIRAGMARAGGPSTFDARSISDITVVTKLNEAVLPLVWAGNDSTLFDEGKISMGKIVGKSEMIYSRYKLTGVIVTGVDFSTPGEVSTIAVNLNFTKIEFEYTPPPA